MQTTTEQDLLQACYSLTTCQAAQGDWSAFALRPGGSSLWTTAAALAALGHGMRQLAMRPRWLERSYKRGWDHLLKTSEGKPIGFNPLTPPDADSSVWLARALNQRIRCPSIQATPTLETASAWLSTSLSYIERHGCDDLQRLSTYNRSDQILRFVGRADDAESHWLNGHPCVSANGRRLGEDLSHNEALPPSPITQMLQNLDTAGKAYWWTDDSIIPALLGEATNKPWILRVPDHDDPDGTQTTYDTSITIEGGEACDQGAFRLILMILSMGSY